MAAVGGELLGAPLVLAHAGHWLAQAAYVSPILVLLGVIGWGRIKERRERGGEGESDSAPRSEPGR